MVAERNSLELMRNNAKLIGGVIGAEVRFDE